MLIATLRRMEPIKPTHALVKRLVPAVAVWAIGKALDSQRVKKRLQKVDESVYKKRRLAVHTHATTCTGSPPVPPRVRSASG